LTAFDSDKPEYALPGARYREWLLAAVTPERPREHTFPVEPQKRTIRFPFGENASVEKPFGCLLVIGTTGNVVVNSWIRWREPSAKVLA